MQFQTDPLQLYLEDDALLVLESKNYPAEVLDTIFLSAYDLSSGEKLWSTKKWLSSATYSNFFIKKVAPEVIAVYSRGAEDQYHYISTKDGQFINNFEFKENRNYPHKLPNFNFRATRGELGNLKLHKFNEKDLSWELIDTIKANSEIRILPSGGFSDFECGRYKWIWDIPATWDSTSYRPNILRYDLEQKETKLYETSYSPPISSRVAVDFNNQLYFVSDSGLIVTEIDSSLSLIRQQSFKTPLKHNWTLNCDENHIRLVDHQTGAILYHLEDTNAILDPINLPQKTSAPLIFDNSIQYELTYKNMQLVIHSIISK